MFTFYTVPYMDTSKRFASWDLPATRYFKTKEEADKFALEQNSKVKVKRIKRIPGYF